MKGRVRENGLSAAALQRLSQRFNVVPFVRDREGELLQLLERAYADSPVPSLQQPERMAAYWQWMQGYPTADGRPPQGWVCLKGGRVVGHFGVLPVQVSRAGREVTACWGRDLIVAPEVRGAGAGPLLIQAAVQGAGVPFLVAGLNEQSYSLFRRMGFLDMGRLPLYLRVYQPDALLTRVPLPSWLGRSAWRRLLLRRPLRGAAGIWARLKSRRPVPVRRADGLTFRTVEGFGEEFDRWWAGLESSFPCVVRRTGRTMAWRYQRHPWHRYTCLAALDRKGWRGLAVVRHGQSRWLPAGFITELLAASGDTEALAGLLREAEEFLLRTAPEPPVFLRCALFHPPLQRALEGSGFLRVPSPLHWMMAPAGASGSATTRPGSEEFWHRSGWMLNAGDSDLDGI